MDTVVVYKSKTGYTKQYAQWIAEELRADIFEAKGVKPELLQNYNTIIYGGGLCASSIGGVKLIKENLKSLKDKKIIIFATGMSVGKESEIEGWIKHNFNEEESKQIRFFYFRGGFDFSKLSFGNKILMKMFKTMLKKQKDIPEDQKEILKAFDKPIDSCERKNIAPLIDYLRS